MSLKLFSLAAGRLTLVCAAILLILSGPALLPAQDAAKPAETPAARFEVKASRTKTVTDGSGRRLTIQRVKPLVLPPAPAAPAPVAMDPAVLKAKRAAWARSAHKERRLVFLSGIQYPGGQTLLQWFAPGADGSWQTYEAWSVRWST